METLKITLGTLSALFNTIQKFEFLTSISKTALDAFQQSLKVPNNGLDENIPSNLEPSAYFRESVNKLVVFWLT